MQENDILTFSVRQVAAKLQISRNLVYEQIKQKKIPTLRFGKVIRIPRAALEAMVTNNATEIEHDDNARRHFSHPEFKSRHTVVNEEAGHVRG